MRQDPLSASVTGGSDSSNAETTSSGVGATTRAGAPLAWGVGVDGDDCNMATVNPEIERLVPQQRK